MLLQITAVELRKALADIEAAEKNGFMYCEAIFETASVNDMGNVNLRYSDLLEKAHPTSGAFNWGRFQNVSIRHRFVDGSLVPIGDTHQLAKSRSGRRDKKKITKPVVSSRGKKRFF